MGILFPNVTEHKRVIKSGETNFSSLSLDSFLLLQFLLAVTGIQYSNTAQPVTCSKSFEQCLGGYRSHALFLLSITA